MCRLIIMNVLSELQNLLAVGGLRVQEEWVCCGLKAPPVCQNISFAICGHKVVLLKSVRS